MAVSYLIRGLLPDTIKRARQRAQAEGTSLAVITKRLFEDYAAETPRDPAAMGKKGGSRRAAKMTAEERTALASAAARARWEKKRNR